MAGTPPTSDRRGGQPTAQTWVRRSAGEGTQGPRVHDWACVRLSEDAPVGMARWLLIRRTLTVVPEQDYFLAYGPADTTELRWCAWPGAVGH